MRRIVTTAIDGSLGSSAAIVVAVDRVPASRPRHEPEAEHERAEGEPPAGVDRVGAVERHQRADRAGDQSECGRERVERM